MPRKRLRNRQDTRARLEHARIACVRAGQCDEVLVEPAKPSSSHGAIPLRQRDKRSVQFETKGTWTHGAAKFQYLTAHRESGEKLRALSWLGLIWHYSKPTVHTPVPIIGRPCHGTDGKAPKIAQSEGEQPVRPPGRRKRGKQPK